MMLIFSKEDKKIFNYMVNKVSPYQHLSVFKAAVIDRYVDLLTNVYGGSDRAVVLHRTNII